MCLENSSVLASASSSDLFHAFVERWLAIPDRLKTIEKGQQAIVTQLDEIRLGPRLPVGSGNPIPKDVPVVDGDRLDHMLRCLAKLTQEQTRLAEQHYVSHIVEPLVQHLGTLYDVVADAGMTARSADGETDRRAPVLSALATMVIELLACYDVHPLNAVPGTPFDPSTMSAHCPPSRDQTGGAWEVTGSIRLGFKFRNGRVLRPQTVTVKQTVRNGCTENQ